MPLIGDFLDVLGATLGKWSLSTKYAFKKLTGKKHVADATAVQNLSAEARREAVAETDGKGIRRRSVQNRKPVSYRMEDVVSHDKPDDCWIVIKDKVCHSRNRSTFKSIIYIECRTS